MLLLSDRQYSYNPKWSGRFWAIKQEWTERKKTLSGKLISKSRIHAPPFSLKPEKQNQIPFFLVWKKIFNICHVRFFSFCYDFSIILLSFFHSFSFSFSIVGLFSPNCKNPYRIVKKCIHNQISINSHVDIESKSCAEPIYPLTHLKRKKVVADWMIKQSGFTCR